MQQVLKRFAKKADLTSLKSDVDESDIHELKNVSSGLDSVQRKVDKLDVVDNEVFKKDVYDEFVKKR